MMPHGYSAIGIAGTGCNGDKNICHFFQNELSAATHLTSRLLKEYDKQVGHFLHKPQVK